MTQDDEPALQPQTEPLRPADREKAERQERTRRGERGQHDESPTEPDASTEQQPT